MSVKHVVLRSMSSGGLESMPKAGPATLAPKLSVDVQLETIPRGEAAELAREKDVIGVAPVIPMRLIAPISVTAAATPAAGDTWGVQAVKADSSPFDGDGIIPAVLDTGIDPNHPAFAGVNLIRKNFTNAGDDDEHGHGTHCAGTIFGRDVSGTRIGIARGVKQAVIGKVLGGNGGGSDTIMQAIQWAVQNGANVISMSLGIDFPGFVKQLEGQGLPTEMATSIALEGYRTNVLLFERLASLVQAGGAFMQATVLVAAAGNESQRDVNPDFEISVSPPAVATGIVSVAALDTGTAGFTIAPFSNVGAQVSGPGVGVISAKRGGGLTAMSGTSMATPHVAGVTTLWAQKLKIANQLNAGLLSARVVGSATTTGLKAGFDPSDIGAGIVQAPQS